MTYYALKSPYTEKLFQQVQYPVSLVTLEMMLTSKEDTVLIVDDIFEDIPSALIKKFYHHPVYYLHKSPENKIPDLLITYKQETGKWFNLTPLSIYQPKQALFGKLFSKVYQSHLIIGEATGMSWQLLNQILPSIYASHDKENCLFIDFYPSADLLKNVESMSLWHYYQAIHHESFHFETLIKTLVKKHPTKPLQVLALELTLKEYLDMDLVLLEELLQKLKLYYNVYYLCDQVKSAIDSFMISHTDIIYTHDTHKPFFEKSFQKEVISIELLS